MGTRHSEDLKHYKAKSSLLWECLGSIGWGCAAGAILAAFVILTLHLGR